MDDFWPFNISAGIKYLIVAVPEWLFRSRILNEGMEKAKASMAFSSLCFVEKATTKEAAREGA